MRQRGSCKAIVDEQRERWSKKLAMGESSKEERKAIAYDGRACEPRKMKY